MEIQDVPEITVNLFIFFFRRVDSLNLETPYHIPEFDPLGYRYSLPDAYVEGQELYLHFFHEQVRDAGLTGDISVEEELK